MNQSLNLYPTRNLNASLAARDLTDQEIADGSFRGSAPLNRLRLPTGRVVGVESNRDILLALRAGSL